MSLWVCNYDIKSLTKAHLLPKVDIHIFFFTPEHFKHILFIYFWYIYSIVSTLKQYFFSTAFHPLSSPANFHSFFFLSKLQFHFHRFTFAKLPAEWYTTWQTWIQHDTHWLEITSNPHPYPCVRDTGWVGGSLHISRVFHVVLPQFYHSQKDDSDNGDMRRMSRLGKRQGFANVKTWWRSQNISLKVIQYQLHKIIDQYSSERKQILYHRASDGAEKQRQRDIFVNIRASLGWTLWIS